MKTCAVCNCRFEDDNAPLLLIDSHGSPRYLCPECVALIDCATEAEGEAREDARKVLGERAKSIRSSEVMRVLEEVLEGKAAPEAEEDRIEEEYEKMRITEEEEEKEKQEAEERRKKENSFASWIPVIAVGLAMCAFLVWFYFFR